MNKIYRYTGMALLMGFSLLAALPSCKPDSPAEATSQMVSLRLISSDHSFLPGGGTGKLLLSEGGFSLKTEAEWIQLGAVNGSEASFTVSPLTEAETRTGIIQILKEGKSINLAITQLGAYDYLIDNLSNYEVDRQGKELILPYLSHSGAKPNVEGLPGWITSSLEEGKLKLQVAPLSGPDRSANLVIKLGKLSETSIAIHQVYGQLTYDQLLGEYDLTYVPDGSNPTVTATTEVKLEAKDKAKNLFTLKGLAADAELGYNPGTSTLVFNNMQTKLADGKLLMFTLSGNDFLKKDGKKDTRLNWSEDLRLLGSWDKQSPEHPSFTFKSPKAAPDGDTFHGVLFWLYDGSSFLGRYRENEAGAIHTLSDIKLVKK